MNARRESRVIVLKSPREIEILRKANLIVFEVLELLESMAKPGVTTEDMDRAAAELTRKRGGKPAFKGYLGYPKNLCASVNDEVVHGIPSRRRVLEDGDIIGVDYGVIYDGFVGDAARTIAIGEPSERASRLMRVTQESLFKGIEAAREGNRVCDIGKAVQDHVESNGYSVVRDFVGHGVGRKLHEEPQVPNYYNPANSHVLRTGMVIAIEPMVNEGTHEVEILDDEWTVVTRDRGLSAHFEHSIAVTPDGPYILSLP
jgi:methionyl aminopeptidase